MESREVMTLEVGLERVRVSGEPAWPGVPLLAYRCSIEIAASPQRVCAIVSDLGRTPQWAGSGVIRGIERRSEGPIGAGTRYRSWEKITMRYGADSEVLVFEPESRLVWRSKPVGERVPYHRWAFALEPIAEGGTRLTNEINAYRAGGVQGLVQRLGFLFTKPHERVPVGMRATLENMKRLAERRGTT
jgi:uncharacterized protein YndB with AHSA1/START domain